MLIDGPPVLPVTDSLILSSYADAVVVVVAAGQTTVPQIERASDLLRQGGAQPVGLVLNKARRKWGNANEYGYKYGYKYRFKYGHVPQGSSHDTAGVNGQKLGGAAGSGDESLTPAQVPDDFPAAFQGDKLPPS